MIGVVENVLPDIAHIDSIYAFIASMNGKEGVMGVNGMPMVFGDIERVNKLKPDIIRMSTEMKVQVKIVKFLTRQTLEIIGDSHS
jgi:hypothetical protein